MFKHRSDSSRVATSLPPYGGFDEWLWRGMTSHSAGDQKKLSQRLPSVWGRWEAGWDYYHYRFTGISAPRSSACLSEELECAEVVQRYLQSYTIVLVRSMRVIASKRAHAAERQRALARTLAHNPTLARDGSLASRRLPSVREWTRLDTGDTPDAEGSSCAVT